MLLSISSTFSHLPGVHAKCLVIQGRCTGSGWYGLHCSRFFDWNLFHNLWHKQNSLKRHLNPLLHRCVKWTCICLCYAWLETITCSLPIFWHYIFMYDVRGEYFDIHSIRNRRTKNWYHTKNIQCYVYIMQGGLMELPLR